jgi:hypothetical protein
MKKYFLNKVLFSANKMVILLMGERRSPQHLLVATPNALPCDRLYPENKATTKD